ncbi:MAG: hypothetical protein GY875_06775 [Gammaproteobacteria bacterium]|nr:hypothetical protein [Gammaproteobacteria bacterium]
MTTEKETVTDDSSSLANFAREEEKAGAIGKIEAEIEKAQQRLDAKERSSKSKIKRLEQKRAKADEENNFSLSLKLSNEIINLMEEECGLRDEVIALYDNLSAIRDPEAYAR